MSKVNVEKASNPAIHYMPGLEEPCIFTGHSSKWVSADWIMWHIRKNPKLRLQEVYLEGNRIVDLLINEPPREVDPEAEPIKYVDNGQGKRLIPRLEWIIWYRHAKKVGFGSARLIAIHPEMENEQGTVSPG